MYIHLYFLGFLEICQKKERILKGGGYSSSRQGTCALRLCTFLVWSALNSLPSKILDETTLLPWMEEILRYQFILIDSYVRFLEDSNVYAGTTLLSLLYDIALGFKWFVFSYHRGRLDPSLLLPLMDSIKQITKNVSNSLRRSRSRRTLESDLLARKIPAGGLQELMRHVQGQMTWAQSLRDVSDFLTESTYRQFMKLMLTSIYTESNNGIIIL